MSERDVNETSCIPGYVCYGSDWDISSSISTPNKRSVVPCRNDEKTFCVRPANEDICSDLTVTFTPGECRGSSFNVTKSISVDFLNPSEIQQIKPTGLPAEINTTLPDLPKCKNLSVSYTCSENNKADVKLSELKPFTDYSCTGLILQNSISINKTTPSVHVRVDCELTITNIKKDLTSTSIELSWKTTSKNCQQVLPLLHELSYDCSCDGQTGKVTSPDGGTCVITGLNPFTGYTCRVRAKYKNKIQVSTGGEVKLQTKVGTPAAVTELKLHVHEHNTIKVSWHRPSTFNGPERKYIIRLNTADDKEVTKKELEGTKYEVEFKDLSYSTSYKVKVTAHNGHYESIPQISEISTLYNNKAVIGFRVFLFIVIVLAFLFLTYKFYIQKFRKSTNDVNDDMELEAIYENRQPPGWHHKEAH
ncbi:receptor-type tyrosine-protein phosphatase C isoform X2 [Haplochromis burtoni]|uniref:receptor-type tyrosine-protein phosphatase C isoform X2 n=1 Tax=Haplochromis burtoni TaxID=8153 RepID=UPI001C2DCB1C|nr:receptor-type tyrosine-protein phosphatase C isoform X2 [Haplochromis burtoni]